MLNESNDITISQLTQRQLEILELVSCGYSNFEIADYLTISECTVKTHIKSIYQRFDFSYSNGEKSVSRIKVALIWLKYKNNIINLKENELIEC